jgi:hypothetical protein
MIKYVTAIALLAGCLENPFEQHCDDPGQPVYPAIGGCKQGAAQGAPGGPCFVDETCGNDALACVGGTCYDCGKTPEPCCGSQMSAAQGSCVIGTCGIPPGEEFFGCVGDGGAPPPGGCAPGVKPNYYVWTLDSKCGTQQQAFCSDDADAQAFADSTFAGVPHGAVSTDPNATAPNTMDACADGSDCVLSPNESLPTTFYYFTTTQIVACEMALDPGINGMCSWEPKGTGLCM